MKKKLSAIVLMSFLLTLFSYQTVAQVVTTTPEHPTFTNPCTIQFDATQGSGGLAGYDGDVYAHTGVITENSTGSGDWKYVQAAWGENIPKCKLTRVADDLYILEIEPSIQGYYGVPDDEEILQMALVFRSATEVEGQWLEGKTASGGDIFIDVFEPTLYVQFLTPVLEQIFVDLNDTIPVEAIATGAEQISLYLDNVMIKQDTGNYIADEIIATDYGTYLVKAVAEYETEMVVDSFFYSVRTITNPYNLLVWTDPTLPTEADNTIVYFDASQGSKGLEGFMGDVYVHTGVITENSSSPSDWKYVQSAWGENVPKCKLTRLDYNLFQLNIEPSVREYYGVPAGEEILQMAFVFRSDFPVSGDYLTGKTETGGDIFIEVYEPGLNITFIVPEKKEVFVDLNDTIPIIVAAVDSDKISLYVDDVLQKEVNGTYLSDSILANAEGIHWIKAVAENNKEIVADSIFYFTQTAVPVPDDIIEGINEINDNTVVLCLYAPYKDYAYVIGDFNNWEIDPQNIMNKSPDGNYFWIQLDNLEAGKEYIFQYVVDGDIRIGDPYADKTSDPWNDKYISDETYPDLIPYPDGMTTNVATVFQTAQEPYDWKYDNYEKPEITDLVVYELLIRDYTHAHTYQSVIDSLPYLKKLGINALELMPVNEFEGNISWGYNPSYFFAPDKYYGPKNILKELIDECHKEGIVVIQDIVLNHHFGQSPMVMLYWNSGLNRPAANSLWFNEIPKHDYNVGYDMNHESEDTKRWAERFLTYWLEEYHVDGFRFDLSKGLTQKNTLGDVGAWGQYDQPRIDILKHYADTIWKVDPSAYVILEHFADNSEETVLAEYDMIVWGNENHHYSEASMAWNSDSDFRWASYLIRGWDKPRNVVYMESHDEERMMFRNLENGNAAGSYNIKDTTTALSRVELAATFFFTIPGPKMIWMFEELGYDYTIWYGGDRVDPKPVRWDYYYDYRRKYLYDFFSVLIDLKKEQDVFRSNDFTMNTSGDMKRINITANPMSAVILGNFNVVDGNIDPHFMHTGKWYEYFTGDSIDVTDVHENIGLIRGEYRIYTDVKLEKPPLNTGIFDMHKTEGDFSFVYPNPSSSGFHIVCDIDKSTDIHISVFNIHGQEIIKLADHNVSAGRHDFRWDGSDQSGNHLEHGIYFYSITTDHGFDTGKLIIQ